jgi:hypothetical protein
MMKRNIISILFLLAGIYVSAQDAMMNKAMTLSISTHQNNDWKMNANIEGTPYKLPQPEDGIFYPKDKPAVITKTRLNYFRSNFEFIVEDKTYLVDEASIDSIIAEGRTYLFKEFAVNGRILPRIVEVVVKGAKNSIYKFTEVDLNPEVQATALVQPKPACYYWNQPVYLIEIGDKIFPITTLKKITDMFPEKETELKAFIKKNKIKKNRTSDLKQLLEYINQFD